MLRAPVLIVAIALAGNLVNFTGGLTVAVADGGGRPAASRTVLFRFAPGQPGNGDFLAACVGMFLGPRLAITAAHCLNGSERVLTVECLAENGQRHIETLTIMAEAQHPTHDMTLLTAGPTRCRTDSVEIAATAGNQDRLYLMDPDGGTLNLRPADAIYRLHTIDISAQHLCLPKGESGTPVFIDRQGTVPLAAGLLISGSRSCPGDYTFVRLDEVRDWIDAARATAN